ncbi:MAG: sulfite exporter TauE/SafE family protein [Bryobacterales bacterium]|nr:sulfite exporter TauE/SafE family protein [Bryobacterales bacterium]
MAYLLGVAGSLHCVQMCGPILLSCTMPLAQRSSGYRAAGHLFYHAGRIATYGLLGAFAGGLGLSLEAVMPWQNAASIAAGGAMLLAGLWMLGTLRRPELVQIKPVAAMTRRAGRLIGKDTAGSKLHLGLWLGLLPCGLVYAALLKALAAGNAVDGGLTMAAFGLGTAGALLGVGLFSVPLGRYFARWSRQLPAIAVTLTGLLLLVHGLKRVTMASGAHHCH